MILAISMQDDESGKPPPRKESMGTLEGAREILRLVGLLRGRDRRRARQVYEFLGTHNNLGRRTLYLNLGYWTEAAE